MLVVWIIVFTVVTGYGFRINRENISALQERKAQVIELQNTNCGLKKFLLSARRARLKAARNEVGDKRANDLEAAESYLVLAKTLKASGRCIIPPSLLEG